MKLFQADKITFASVAEARDCRSSLVVEYGREYATGIVLCMRYGQKHSLPGVAIVTYNLL